MTQTTQNPYREAIEAMKPVAHLGDPQESVIRQAMAAAWDEGRNTLLNAHDDLVASNASLTADRDALYNVLFKIRSSAITEIPIRLLEEMVDVMEDAERGEGS